MCCKCFVDIHIHVRNTTLDRRLAATEGDRWRRFAAVTSFVPFAALLAGRRRWAWTELRRPILWGLGLFALLLALHPALFGVRPY